MIVEKAVKMANMMNVPILGLVENMSYFVCPDCGKKLRLFGKGSGAAAEELGLPLLAELPIDPDLAQLVDNGEFEKFTCTALEAAAKEIDKKFS